MKRWALHTRIASIHRCKSCRREWSHWISSRREEIRAWCFPCPSCAARFGLDVVGLLIQVEEKWLTDDEDELPLEDFHVVMPVTETGEE